MKNKAKEFKDFICKYQTGLNIDHFNPSSDLQLQQYLYAPYIPPENSNIKQSK